VTFSGNLITSILWKPLKLYETSKMKPRKDAYYGGFLSFQVSRYSKTWKHVRTSKNPKTKMSSS